MKGFAIEIDRVSKRFGSATALTHVSLRVEPGSIYCLLGENGAGKSTLISLMTSLSYPTLGRVRIAGVDTRSSSIQAIRRRLGFVPQRCALYEHLTGLEFIRFIGGLYAVRPSALVEAEQLLGDLGMTESARRPIGTYSVGMKRRIAIVAATVHDPKCLIVDEPIASLDSAGAEVVARVLMRFRNHGRSVVCATHRVRFASRLADRVGILSGGRLRFDGPLTVRKGQSVRDPDRGLTTLLERIGFGATHGSCTLRG